MWCPKYRRPVLEGPVAERLKALLAEKTAELGRAIHALEVRPDQVHLFVESAPMLCVAEIVHHLRGFTSRISRDEFPSLRSRLPTLWTRSDFAGSVGHVAVATVARHIAEQKGK